MSLNMLCMSCVLAPNGATFSPQPRPQGKCQQTLIVINFLEKMTRLPSFNGYYRTNTKRRLFRAQSGNHWANFFWLTETFKDGAVFQVFFRMNRVVYKNFRPMPFFSQNNAGEHG